MRKYWHVINIGIQNNLAYRVNFLARALFGLIPLTAMLYLWRSIYAGKGDSDAVIAGYSLAQMLSYYLVVQIVDALTAVNEDDWAIAADIKDGNISQFLLKPLSYLWYRLCLFISGRITYLAVAAVPLALFIGWHHENFVLPQSCTSLALFCISLVLTALLQFLMSYAMASLAFWLQEVSTFIFIFYAFEYLASGHLFPLDVLPAGLRAVMLYTPFPYQLYFPVSIYMGKAQGDALWFGFAVQLIWVFIAYAIARLTWARGLRKYSAVGG
jgi:ABC-2 type transport system permease protein